MREGLPPDYLRRGQGFQSQRAKFRAKGADTVDPKSDARFGPKPKDVFSGNMRNLKGEITARKITEQPSNQEAYGTGHELVRRYQKFGKPVGKNQT